MGGCQNAVVLGFATRYGGLPTGVWGPLLNGALNGGAQALETIGNKGLGLKMIMLVPPNESK